MKEIFVAENEEKLLRLLNPVVVVLCTVVALMLCMSKSLGYDEAYTIGMINRSYKDIVEITANDVHSPWYYFALKFCCEFFGESYWIYVSKLFSVAFYVAHLIVGGRFCQKIYNRKIEFFWLVLSGLMPAMIIQAASVRMYTMGLFFFTLTAYLAYSLYKKESLLKWIGFTLSAISTMYIHTFSMIEVFVLYLLFMGVLIYKKRYKSLIAFFSSGIAAAGAYIPWLLVLWHQIRRWAGIEEGWSNTIEELRFDNCDKFLAEWFSSLENPHGLTILFTVALFIYVIYYVRCYVNETKDRIPYVGVGIAGVVVAVGIIVSVALVPCFLGRYIFPTFGLVWLFIAVGMGQIQNRCKQFVILICVALCSLISFKEEWRLEKDFGLEQYIAYVDENVQEDDVLMADTYFNAMMTIYSPEARYMIYGNKPNACLLIILKFLQNGNSSME